MDNLPFAIGLVIEHVFMGVFLLLATSFIAVMIGGLGIIIISTINMMVTNV